MTILLGVLTVAILAQAQAIDLTSVRVAGNAAEFATADRNVRIKTLRAISEGKLRPNSIELQAIVGSGLDDRDRYVRLEAVGVLSKQAGLARFGRKGDPVAVDAAANMNVVSALGNRLRSVLTSDSDDRVRLESLLTLINLEVGSGQGPNDVKISPAFAAFLAAAYRQQKAAVLRSEIVKTLALSHAPTAGLEATFVSSLSDPAPSVVQFGLMGIARHKAIGSLPAASELLEHPDARVRTAAAMAIASFGPDAANYAAAVQAALSRETDDTARQTLRGALQRITPKVR